MRKLFFVFLSLAFILVSCNNANEKPIVKINDNSLNESSKSNAFTNEGSIQQSSSVSNRTQDIANNNQDFKLVDQQSKDINNDGINEDIGIYSLYNEGQRFCLRVKINNSEKLYEFYNSALNGIRKIQFVNLGNKKTGILIPLYGTEDETNDTASIHNGCIVAGYEGKEIVTLLDAVNHPVNERINYNVSYLGDFIIKFSEKVTSFQVTYKLPDTYNFNKDESEKRLQHINDIEYPSEVAIDYNQIKIQDLDVDGIDEIHCFKHIPGIYHNDALGDISYTFKFTSGKYELTYETLKHWNSDTVIKNMKVEIHTSDEIVVQVHDLFNGDKTTLEDTKRIINLIPDINWSKYAKKNFDEFFMIMEWLGKLKISDEAMMTKILNATNGLDGAYTEAYCDVVKNLFFSNKGMFTKALSDIDEKQLKQISTYLHFTCTPDEAKNVKEYLKGISELRAKLFLESFNKEMF